MNVCNSISHCFFLSACCVYRTHGSVTGVRDNCHVVITRHRQVAHELIGYIKLGVVTLNYRERLCHGYCRVYTRLALQWSGVWYHS
jgi:hypothetical protein